MLSLGAVRLILEPIRALLLSKRTCPLYEKFQLPGLEGPCLQSIQFHPPSSSLFPLWSCVRCNVVNVHWGDWSGKA